MSFAVMPGAKRAVDAMRMRRGFFCQSVCVISTCATSDAPMPKA